MPIMLWIAAIIEAIIGNYADMGILLGIQFVNAGISFYETTKVCMIPPFVLVEIGSESC